MGNTIGPKVVVVEPLPPDVVAAVTIGGTIICMLIGGQETMAGLSWLLMTIGDGLTGMGVGFQFQFTIRDDVGFELEMDVDRLMDRISNSDRIDECHMAAGL